MNNNKETRFNYLGGMLLLVFFFFFIGNLSKGPNQHNYSSQKIEVSSHIQSNNHAISNGQDFFLSKHIISALDLSHFNLISFNCKLEYFNSLTIHKLAFYQTNEVLIRPIIIKQLRYYYYASNNEVPPILS